MFKYVLFVRKLQVDYMLEPAGARGVWGLDEYQFLPFIFGASQLIGNREITPKSVKDDDVLKKVVIIQHFYFGSVLLLE